MDLRGRRVVVWGFGRHGGGAAAAAWCAAQGAEVSILDSQAPSQLGDPAREAARRWPWHLGDHRHCVLSTADRIVVNPAIPPHAIPPTLHGRVVGDLDLFLHHHRAARILITGTKGKTTTTRLAAHLLGWPAVGNSQTPLLRHLLDRGPWTPVVMECSSFQLARLPGIPRIDLAILTSLDQDHLDWHGDQWAYREAKLRVLRASAARLVGKEITGPSSTVPVVSWDGETWRDHHDRPLAAASDCRLLGDHTRRNVALALAAVRYCGLAAHRIAPALRRFAPIPHRLCPVPLPPGPIAAIDDSIATTPAACAAALASLPGPLVVLIGGVGKGCSWRSLVPALATSAAQAVLFGRDAARIARDCAAVHQQLHRVSDLVRAVERAWDLLPTGGTVLLSPACASFDAYRDFAERGRHFAACCRARAMGRELPPHPATTPMTW